MSDTPIPVILDCDPGHDDAIALLLALASPELDLLGVTTTYGNQTLEKTTANALRVLELVNRTDVPVATGAAGPLVRDVVVAAHVHGESGLDGPTLPAATTTPFSTDAVAFIAELVGSTPRPVTLVPTGPLTNVAQYHAQTYGWNGAPIHDAVAVAHVIRPGLVETRHRNVEIELQSELCRGRTVVDLWNRTDRAPNVHVGVDIDAPAFFDLLVERIARLP